ncbi:MAG: ABC transporter permease [Candidatus Acidiferrales bacterium]
MKSIRKLALVLLAAIFLAALLAEFIAPTPYALQFRDSTSVQPSLQFPLGTDQLGRDRFSRLVYGTRVSLLLAPAAALLSTLLAALVGGLAGYLGGWWERTAMTATDLFLSLPWLFLLLTVRAALPLNTPPTTSVLVTFALLGLLGWPMAARVVCAGASSLRTSDIILHAKASGCRGLRLVLMHVLPNLKPVLRAQFLLSIPVFILAEANLGMLGLGVADPLPSWGNLLKELASAAAVRFTPALLVPVLLLLTVVSCFHILLSSEEVSA